MPDYLPLCASRQDLLPVACRSCAWWQTSGGSHCQAIDVAEERRRWISAVESSWGSPGLLLERADAAAAIHYAPVEAVPRLQGLPFAPSGRGTVLLFCLRAENGLGEAQARRMLQRALGHLKERGLQEVYAFARPFGSPENSERCEFFSLGFLESNGFRRVRDNGQIYLMRIDLRGLLCLLSQVESAMRRVLRNEPTPSPATWVRRGTS